MGSYQLTKDADRDLQEIADYTLETWGYVALEEYRRGLKTKFENIGRRNLTIIRRFTSAMPDLYVTSYRQHYIFYRDSGEEKPVILGVIHQKRDVVNQLSQRLKG